MEEKILTAGDKKEAWIEHPEREQIFILEKLILKTNHPYYFNFRDDLKATPFGEMSADDINWDRYNFLIEVGEPVGSGLSEISVTFSTGNNKELLELLDMRSAKGKQDIKAEDGELTRDLTAEQCMEIIEKFFNG